MTIEKKFIQQNLKELQIKEYIFATLGKVGVAHVKLQRTPLGEKILISCSRPGLVVGRAGSNIQKLTVDLKAKFGLENPQIEIEELTNPMLESSILAEMISNSIERFGSSRFKGIAHKALMDAMNAGALGIEVLISGIVPSQRAKTWRFYAGYLKKCGDVAIEGVDIAYRIAIIKRGVIGIKVSIMPPTTILPDRIDVIPPSEMGVEEVTGTPVAEELVAKIEEEKPKKVAKKTDGKPRAPRKSTKSEISGRREDSSRAKAEKKSEAEETTEDKTDDATPAEAQS